MGYIHLQIEWNPWLGGYRPQILVISAHYLQLNLLNPPPKKSWRNPPPPEKIPGYATAVRGKNGEFLMFT
jgi:hypothetical protein